jgi:hypothetical protein
LIVKVWRERTSEPIEYAADAAYQKGDLYCVVYTDNGRQWVDKYPITHLFRVTESN